METPLHLTIVLNYWTSILLLLLIGGLSLGSSPTTSNLADEFGDSTSYQHGSILSPLLKALTAQGVPWRDTTLITRPEPRYVRYMKRLYRVSSRHERSSEGNNHLYNTVRLITPRDECLEQGNEFFMQDLSYNLDRVRAKEQLLKSVLLYSFDQEQATSMTTLCYLDVKEQDTQDQCPLCPSTHHSVNFLFHTDRRRKWVEVDITAFLQPLIQSHKKDIHLLINLTCVEGRGRGAKGGGEERSGRGPVELHLRSPSLLLYLNDTSELAHQRWPPTRSRGHPRSANEMDTFESLVEFKPERRISRSERRRLRRESLDLSTNNAGGKTSTKTVLPDLLPSSDFPTSDCALYDFRVSFSELKLSHWIIFPHRYNPRYCKGTCPRAVGFIYGSPRHTFFQNMIYHKLDSSVPRPSCVPSEYNPLSVLTLEADSIAYKELDEMIATRCTCR
ncbi:growth/differentiation factor 9-like [Coregonus clupeaformis]|uniref:growth/differentiation factor 9-like n=1 Tax=Coregonus clupeaformis TaxID=59861 RepID=UPI001BDFC8B8|nr:growth/differentiation factor 9-like [Coregonus clupeaformis]